MNTTSLSLLQQLRLENASEAWGRFADLYTPLLFFWACKLGLQKQDAADLVQDVFLRLLQKLPTFQYQAGGSFRGWLHTVLINEWRMRRRRRALPAAGPAALDDVAVPDTAGDLGEAEYHQYLAHRALGLMKAQFQPATWQACWLQVVEGRTAAEAGAALGLSEGAAYVAKSRVLRRLRQELEGLLE